MKANDDGALQEESTGNNASPLLRSWCKYYTEPQPPVVPGVNLYIDRLDAPASCKPGVASTLTYTLRNTGDADLGDVEATHEVFISDSRSFSAATATPCEVTAKGGSTRNLKAGRSVDFTLSFTVPVTQQGGDKFVYVVVDRANAIGEREVGDNRAYSAIRIDGNLPDLGVEALSVPDTIMTSVATPVSFAVANTGQWRASAFTLSVYLSADNAYDRSDLLLATIPVNGLHRGASVDCPAEVSVADDKPGKWYLVAVAEGRDDDLDRANNTVAVPVTVEQSVLPDLRVEALSLGGTLTAGQKATVRATVANVGAHATRTDKWADTYYLSTSAVLNTATATQVGSKAHVGALAEGGSYDSEVTLNIPPSMQGNYMLFAVTDAADGVTEADENNNARSVAVYVNGVADTPAELTVTDVQAPATITAGADVTLSYTLRNGGAFAAEGEVSDVIYLSADDKWDVSDQMVGVARTEVSIEPGGALTRTVTGRITNMPEGDYYLIVKRQLYALRGRDRLRRQHSRGRRAPPPGLRADKPRPDGGRQHLGLLQARCHRRLRGQGRRPGAHPSRGGCGGRLRRLWGRAVNGALRPRLNQPAGRGPGATLPDVKRRHVLHPGAGQRRPGRGRRQHLH